MKVERCCILMLVCQHVTFGQRRYIEWPLQLVVPLAAPVRLALVCLLSRQAALSEQITVACTNSLVLPWLRLLQAC